MRTRAVFLLIFILFIKNAFTQTITIEDPNFLQALLTLGVDKNNDQLISVEEAAQITELDVNYKEIESLGGIEAFSNLSYLDCGDNRISSIDLGNLSALEYLYCQNNLLSALDVSNCPKLKVLTLNTNFVSAINLQENPELFWLDLSYTHIDSLNLEAQDKIETIACASTMIRNLELPGKAALSQIIAPNCKISNIDLSGDSALKVLEINGNNIEYLDLSDCISIDFLAIRNMPNLSRICVPFYPFESSALTILMSGSPNAYFTDCTPPILVANKTMADCGDSIIFESTKNGSLYLTPDSTSDVLDSILNNYIMQQGIESSTPIEIALNDTADRIYKAFVIDDFNNISEAIKVSFTACIPDTTINELYLISPPATEVKIYPNPAYDVISIKSEKNNYFISIYSILGQRLYFEYCGSKESEINISNLDPGCYLLFIYTSEHLFQKTLIKQ